MNRTVKTDRYINRAFKALALLCSALFVLIMCFLLKESWAFIQNDPALTFLYTQSWHPLEGHFGMASMVMASLAVTGGALLLAFPLGLGCAIFITYFTNAKSAAIFRSILILQAGIPSVVFGLWGLTELVPLISSFRPPGTSLLAASAVLALMILPTIALTCSAALRSVPEELLAGATALGFQRKTLIWSVAVPAARVGIGSGVLLAVARALGETMVVLMVAGNVVQHPSGLFEPIRTLTANIALEMAYAMGTHRSSLFASGLLLTLIVWGLAWAASNMRRRQERVGG